MNTADSAGTAQGRPMTPQAALKVLQALEEHLSAARAHAQEALVRADKAIAPIDYLAPALGVTADEVFFSESEARGGERGNECCRP
jgi:hypothetical protein